MSSDLLPVHGFVLAGGQSSRMGRDKATVCFQGQPMVERALKKLRTFCADVAIAGNRDDLAVNAPVVLERRVAIGPVAGLEAGLQASQQAWALFVPVDVPLMPEALLQRWTVAVLAKSQGGLRLSFLRTHGVRQPAFCLLHRSCLPTLSRTAELGVRKLGQVYESIAAELGPGSLWIAEAELLWPEGNGSGPDLMTSFSNLNTPEDLALLERWAQSRV